MGDNINIASRLQSLTKEFDASIIISAATYKNLAETERTTSGLKYLSPKIVKGKKHPVEVFSIT